MKQLLQLVLCQLIVFITCVGTSAQGEVKIVSRWKHLDDNIITLYSNGKINNPSGVHSWSKVGNTMTLRWKDAKAPGGYWIDTCTISKDGKSYKGTNQLRRPISGTLVVDAPMAKAVEKPKGSEKTDTQNSDPVGPKPQGPAEVPSEDLWKVLQRVSLAYQLDYQKVPRDHSLPPYIPLMAAKSARVREVAALSTSWEINVWDVSEAFQKRMDATSKGLFGGIPIPRPADAKPDPVRPTVPRSVELAIAKADSEGLLIAYETLDKQVNKVIEEGKDNISKMSEATAKFYQLQLVYALKQSTLWNKAEALAKSAANGNNSRGKDIEVEGVFEPGKTWGTVLLRNKSKTDLEHVTFTLTAPTKAMPPGHPALDFFLGAGVIGSRKPNADVNDPIFVLESLKSGFNLSSAAANERSFNEMPVRVFVHIPKLAAGKECEVQLFRSWFDYSKTFSATYSVWAPNIAIEVKPLPGYEEAKNNKSSPGYTPAKSTPADAKDTLTRGSTWRGSVKWTQAGAAEVTIKTEIIITGRNGNNFKGTISYAGSDSRSDIVGIVGEETIQFEFESAGGKRGLLHTGTLKGNRLEVTYVDEANKRKSVTTLDRVQLGKK